jgi:hypothetical protein
MRRFFCFPVLACAAIACGNSTSGGGGSGPSVSGSIANHSFDAADAVGLVGTLANDAGVTGYEVDVVMTTWTGACTSFMKNESPPNSAVLEIAVASATPVVARTYAIATNGPVQVGYGAQGANCVGTASAKAQSGTITYDTVGPPTVEGSVDAIFPDGSRVSGHFAAPVCGVSLMTIASEGGGLMGCGG